MADKSSIEWTDATWNPIVGCSIVSPACTNCYAMAMAARLERMIPTAQRGDSILPSHYSALTQPSKAGPVWTERVTLAPDHILTKPLHWKRPRKIFVNSMGDLFHESVPDKWIDRVFAVMALAPQHTFQILTKRSKRLRAWTSGDRARMVARACVDLWIAKLVTLDDETWPVQSIGDIDLPDDITLRAWPLVNCWLGVTAEDQTRADERIPDLLATPAAVRFVSIEPMLGPIKLNSISAKEDDEDGEEIWIDALTGEIMSARTGCQIGEGPVLDLIIAGGESGPNARPSHPDWFRSLKSQCEAAGVAFFMKQMSGRTKSEREAIPQDLNRKDFPDAPSRAMLAASPEPPVSGWRDIATAPSAKPVLVAYKNRCDKWRVVKAVRYEQYQNEQPADDDEGEVGEYCEEKDAYFVRAGWYELIDNWDDFGFVAIYEGDPVAWMNLPAPPKHQTLGPMTESRFILTPWGLLTVSIAVATGTQEPK